MYGCSNIFVEERRLIYYRKVVIIIWFINMLFFELINIMWKFYLNNRFILRREFRVVGSKMILKLDIFEFEV